MQQHCAVALAAPNATAHCASKHNVQCSETVRRRFENSTSRRTFTFPPENGISDHMPERGIFPPNLKFLKASI